MRVRLPPSPQISIHNGDELEFDKEIRVKGRSTQLTGEQVELAMAA